MTKKDILDLLKFVPDHTPIQFRDGSNKIREDVGIIAIPSEYVVVNFFKDCGKWYTSEKVKWTGLQKDCLLIDAFNQSLRDHFRDTPNRLSGMIAVCMEPLHEHSHPVMSTGWFGTSGHNRRVGDIGR